VISGVRSSVRGTPTFFVNGVRHEGAYDLPALFAAIESAAEHVALEE
jgi:protein-disulfide isomerase